MIELCNVNLRAGDFTLSGISFKVETGQYAMLMGRTGRGKTTILESICGLRRVESGKILIHGTDVTDWPPADREIGYVPQDLALFPTLTVEEHLQFALRLRGQAKTQIAERTAELADVLSITHLLRRKIQGLSGGESQRVALGRALSFRPSVLLLDEPLSALDESTRQEMQSLLRKVKETTGVTTLHVTHSSDEATALADRCINVTDGELSEST
jgi:ABC-type sugar transport system ATPase subunit